MGEWLFAYTQNLLHIELPHKFRIKFQEISDFDNLNDKIYLKSK